MIIRKTLLVVCLLPACCATALHADEIASADDISEALSKGKIKVLLRYNAQYRDSNLRVLQDSSTPDIPDEKT